MKRRYLAFQTFKLFLVAISCLSAGGLFLFYQQDVNAEAAKDPVIREVKEEWGDDIFTSKALNANFDAVDEKGQHYKINAHSAVELADGTVELNTPTYVITLTNKTVVTIKALKGILDQQNKKLNLSGDVVVIYGNEYTIKTPISKIDLRYGYAHGEDKIQGSSHDMKLAADRYRVEEKGDRVILEGNAKLQFHVAS